MTPEQRAAREKEEERKRKAVDWYLEKPSNRSDDQGK